MVGETDDDPVHEGHAVAERIEAVLGDRLAPLHQRVRDIDPRVGELAGLLLDFVLGGGKRLRPRFALAGWAASVPEPVPAPPDDIVTACAALELVQACALVHDDIIDASDTRRGRATVHRTVESSHRAAGWAGDPARYGVHQAILIGDLALSWAGELFHASVPPDALPRVSAPFSEMLTEVLSGQMLDVLAENELSLDPETPERVNRFKTAAYTVERPLHIGAALAGAPDATIRALRRFGVDIGIAFQLRDDLLGVFGDPGITGKPSGDDLREGKRTLLVARGIGRSGGADAEFLTSVLGTALSPADLDRARGILVDSGAVDAVESEIDRLTADALSVLDSPGLSATGRARLADLADAATRRSV